MSDLFKNGLFIKNECFILKTFCNHFRDTIRNFQCMTNLMATKNRN